MLHSCSGLHHFRKMGPLLFGFLLLLTDLPAADIDSLVERNPFGKEPKRPSAAPPPPPPTAPAPQLAAQFEWIGFFQSQGTSRFGFRDRTTNRSFWVPEGGTENGLSVVGFDLGKREVQVRQGTHYGVIGFKETNYATGAPPPQRIPSQQARTPVPPQPGSEANSEESDKPRVVRRRIIVPRRTAASEASDQ